MFERETEVLPLVSVGDVESLGGAVGLAVYVQLLHLLLGRPDPDEAAELGALLRLSQTEQL